MSRTPSEPKSPTQVMFLGAVVSIGGKILPLFYKLGNAYYNVLRYHVCHELMPITQRATMHGPRTVLPAVQPRKCRNC